MTLMHLSPNPGIFSREENKFVMFRFFLLWKSIIDNVISYLVIQTLVSLHNSRTNMFYTAVILKMLLLTMNKQEDHDGPI